MFCSQYYDTKRFSKRGSALRHWQLWWVVITGRRIMIHSPESSNSYCYYTCDLNATEKEKYFLLLCLCLLAAVVPPLSAHFKSSGSALSKKPTSVQPFTDKKKTWLTLSAFSLQDFDGFVSKWKSFTLQIYRSRLARSSLLFVRRFVRR